MWGGGGWNKLFVSDFHCFPEFEFELIHNLIRWTPPLFNLKSENMDEVCISTGRTLVH